LDPKGLCLRIKNDEKRRQEDVRERERKRERPLSRSLKEFFSTGEFPLQWRVRFHFGGKKEGETTRNEKKRRFHQGKSDIGS